MRTIPREDALVPSPNRRSSQVTKPTAPQDPVPAKASYIDWKALHHSGSQWAKARDSDWKALHHSDFRLYFLGSLTSNLGTWMQTTAQVVLVYQLTSSVFAVGVVISAQFAGSLVLGPWAAVVASRIGGRRMLVITQLASAGVAGFLAVREAAGSLGESGLILGALALGMLFTFALPVQTALVPRLVPEGQRDAEAAMAMNSVSYNAGRALAPALCVAVIVTIGFTWAFALNAISFVIYALVLMKVRPRDVGETASPARARDGLKAACVRPRILLLLAMVAAVTFADDPVLIIGPALAHRVLHSSADLPAYFLSALGLGTVLGSMWPTRSPDSWDKSATSRRAAWSLLALAVAMIVFSVGFATWLSLLAAFAAGVAALRTGAVTQTQLMRLRPVNAASVMALWAICWAGTKPVASLVDGWLASHLPHLWMAGAALTLPALGVALAEICLSKNARNRLRKPVKRWLVDPVSAMPSAGGKPQTAGQGSLGKDQRQVMRPMSANGTAAAPGIDVSHMTGVS
jgi:predicted MFS family arabinose efflux permease